MAIYSEETEKLLKKVGTLTLKELAKLQEMREVNHGRDMQ